MVSLGWVEGGCEPTILYVPHKIIWRKWNAGGSQMLWFFLSEIFKNIWNSSFGLSTCCVIFCVSFPFSTQKWVYLHCVREDKRGFTCAVTMNGIKAELCSGGSSSGYVSRREGPLFNSADLRCVCRFPLRQHLRLPWGQQCRFPAHTFHLTSGHPGITTAKFQIQHCPVFTPCVTWGRS